MGAIISFQAGDQWNTNAQQLLYYLKFNLENSIGHVYTQRGECVMRVGSQMETFGNEGPVWEKQKSRLEHPSKGHFWGYPLK